MVLYGKVGDRGNIFDAKIIFVKFWDFQVFGLYLGMSKIHCP